MENVAGWIAPAATMIAAMMTAANLGARVTGWGFAVFVIGSISWSIVGVASGQTNLVLTNGFLTLVNFVGVWRWLGRQVRYEDGGGRASERSRRAASATLVPATSLAGAKLLSNDGEQLGSVVEAMLECDGGSVAYVVVSAGGIGGLGEKLHAIDARALEFSPDGLRASLTADRLAALPTLEEGCWPESRQKVARPT